jgi:hypothetical protein
MNHQQARLEAILQTIADRSVNYDGFIEAAVPVDTLTELSALGYDLRALERDIQAITNP